MEIEDVIKESIQNPLKGVVSGLAFAVALRITGQKKIGNIIAAGILGFFVAPVIFKSENKNGKYTAVPGNEKSRRELIKKYPHLYKKQ